MITEVINRISSELQITFNEVFKWFDVDERLMNYAPADSGWTVRQILEHISLVNHFLLILIRKGTARSLEMSKANDYPAMVENYHFDWEALELIGQHQSFYWNRPQHMEPKGTTSLKEVKDDLALQVSACDECLIKLKNGEGVLHKTMMTVNNLGKIDVYHYIYFLVQHARRHIAQMEKVKTAFEGYNETILK